ncbi:putative transposase [Nonomuraea muscovyensis]|uniref:Putative transposase n=1 Tax=Nonomuraea muscovyensis TaxID=1124761 RepID=A0A7X0C1D5_9ACTN|nr:hypothetical protein [Nonomuraea muscovyensis]MBB6346618.1 putative transposase [Nonomuraea muscovyensis]
MTREVRTSPGAAFDLGYPVVWCPQCRRPVVGGRVKTRLRDLIHAKADEHGHPHSGRPTLWSWFCFLATAGAESAKTVRRCIEAQDGRAPGAGGRA